MLQINGKNEIYLQLYSSNIISTKGITTLVYEVEVRRNGLNKGFLFKKN